MYGRTNVTKIVIEVVIVSASKDIFSVICLVIAFDLPLICLWGTWNVLRVVVSFIHLTFHCVHIGSKSLSS